MVRIMKYYTSLKTAVLFPYNFIKLFHLIVIKKRIELETSFQHKNQDYKFNTIIHLDADIYNFIPHLKYFEDAEALIVLKNARDKHFKKIKDAVEAISNQYTFFSRVIDSFLVLINLFMVLELFIRGISMTNSLLEGLVLVSTILFRNYLKSYCISFIIRFIVWIVQFFWRLFR